MSVSATAPAGGVECDVLDSDGDGLTDEEGADLGTDPDDPDTDTDGDDSADGVLPATGGPPGMVLMLLLGLASLGGGVWLLRRWRSAALVA